MRLASIYWELSRSTYFPKLFRYTGHAFEEVDKCVALPDFAIIQTVLLGV